MHIDSIISSITNPDRLWSHSEVYTEPCPVPERGGLYAFYFKDIPPEVPVSGCNTKDGKTLLYVGISPRNANSNNDLCKRVTTHYRGNAEGSTMRLSLGVLLAILSNFPLRRVGSGRSKTFTRAGEQWLNRWMEENAFVCWVEHDEPWSIKREILAELLLPLNIQHSEHNVFSKILSSVRSAANQEANLLPIVD